MSSMCIYIFIYIYIYILPLSLGESGSAAGAGGVKALEGEEPSVAAANSARQRASQIAQNKI